MAANSHQLCYICGFGLARVLYLYWFVCQKHTLPTSIVCVVEVPSLSWILTLASFLFVDLLSFSYSSVGILEVVSHIV